MTLILRRLTWILTACAVLAVSQFDANADEWPRRPVRVLVPFGAGGSGDTIARIVAERLASTFGQQFVVENRTGAGGALGARAIATSPPDGYTIGITNLSVLSLIPVINAEVNYDPIRALPEKKESEGIPLRARIGFKNRAGREASTEWASRIRRICVHG
jgi:tripartite-type tricarboxylate transporter receptor subunit TctC